MWKKEQEALVNAVKNEGGDFVLGGDIRADSPGKF